MEGLPWVLDILELWYPYEESQLVYWGRDLCKRKIGSLRVFLVLQFWPPFIHHLFLSMLPKETFRRILVSGTLCGRSRSFPMLLVCIAFSDSPRHSENGWDNDTSLSFTEGDIAPGTSLRTSLKNSWPVSSSGQSFACKLFHTRTPTVDILPAASMGFEAKEPRLSRAFRLPRPI